MGATRRRCPTRRTLSILAILGLVAGMLAAVAPAAIGVVNTCTARNVTQNTPSSSHLQRVIRAANPGDTIAVKYVCVGSFTIAKDLTLIGKLSRKGAEPILHANQMGRVLRVSAEVKLINLTITGGDTAHHGGGIRSIGTLTLRDTVVRGNTARFSDGGGIYSEGGGTVILNGSSSVSGNTTSYGGIPYGDGGSGGGIYSDEGGTVILNGSSSVSANRAAVEGGGIYDSEGTVTLNDSSSVNGNTADNDAGIRSYGIVTLNDSSQVSGNIAGHSGGGIGNSGTLTLNDSSSVSGNTARLYAGGIGNSNTLTLNDSSSVNGNTAGRKGGGISNGGTLTLRNSSSVSGNIAGREGGGIYAYTTPNVCDATGVDEWIGAISPNDPDDPPTVTWITCT